MSEEAAIYRLDIAEAQAQARVLVKVTADLEQQAALLDSRVRQLEDAIMLHRDRWDVADRDELLYTVLDEPWT